jgi:hypothetical protein
MPSQPKTLFPHSRAQLATNPDDVAKQIMAIARGAWRAIGVFEMLGAVREQR